MIERVVRRLVRKRYKNVMKTLDGQVMASDFGGEEVYSIASRTS